MFYQWIRDISLFAITVVFCSIALIAPVSAMTLSFKTEGVASRDGMLTGQLIFDQAALEKVKTEASEGQGLDEPIPLSQIKDAEFKFKYTSPYSGVEHTEANLCGKKIRDIGGYEKDALSGGGEPMLVLSLGGLPEFIDFSSCIGDKGSVSSKISRRDRKLASSTVDSLFGKLSVFEQDVMGNVIYRKIQPIKFTIEP
ncbi:MAG: hypothetical protein HC847_12700 [Hydrococcus sp. RU_2_2]|jgi:hypothetical protein|nr:hypothetical protein [Hydrococcus sp. RU_2_2]NJP18550.1 hypothetical protein [Hydrococcus sp. CRU_1_1]